MGFGPDIWELMIAFLLLGGGILLPIILIVLLAIWLVNKKRRDQMMIERLISIKQTLDEIREQLARNSDLR